jgi:hypothetical protein
MNETKDIQIATKQAILQYVEVVKRFIENISIYEFDSRDYRIPLIIREGFAKMFASPYWRKHMANVAPVSWSGTTGRIVRLDKSIFWGQKSLKIILDHRPFIEEWLSNDKGLLFESTYAIYIDEGELEARLHALNGGS